MKILLILTALSLSFPIALKAETEPSCDDGKYYCKDMDSCADARYHLEQCGLSRLDSDGDGIPCESICGKGGKKQSKKSKQQIKTLLAEQEKENTEEGQSQ